jgi:ATP-dependent Clp protease ATP-binding subunit ClpC
VISIGDDAIEWLLARTLGDRSYGARPLRRAIQRHVEDALSEAFIRGRIRGGRPIAVGVKDGGLWYQQDEQGGTLSS